MNKNRLYVDENGHDWISYSRQTMKGTAEGGINLTLHIKKLIKEALKEIEVEKEKRNESMERGMTLDEARKIAEAAVSASGKYSAILELFFREINRKNFNFSFYPGNDGFVYIVDMESAATIDRIGMRND